MSKATRSLRLLSILVAASLAVDLPSAAAKEFTYDPKVNQEIARRLNIPVYFALPASARAALPRDIDTADRLIDFRHPDALEAKAKVGLRLVVSRRPGLAGRLARSGLVQTGDLLLTFRPAGAQGRCPGDAGQVRQARDLLP
jgi:hypothetical protein